jgi:PAS domain S-box-containing protein
MKRSTLFSAVLVFITIIVLLGLFYLPYWSVRNKTIASFDSEQLILANQAVKGIKSFFETYTKALAYFAGQPAIIELDDSGRMLMEDFLSIHTADLTAVSRIDATGRILYTTPEVEGVIGTDISDQPHIHLTMATHQPVIGEVFTAVQGYNSIAFVYPVFDNQLYVGSIGFLIKFSQVVSQYMDQIRVADRGFAMMLSRNGVGLYCPNGEHVGRKISEYFADEPEMLRLSEKMMSGMQGSMSFTAGVLPQDADTPPVTRYAVYVPVNLPGGNFWSIVVANPENDVLATMHGFRNQWFMVTAAALCAILLLSYLLNRTLARNRQDKNRRAAEEQLVQLLDFTPMGLVVYSKGSGELVYVNKAALEFIGGVLDDIIGKSIFDFVHLDSLEFFLNRLSELQEGASGQAANIKIVIPESDLVRDVEISSTCLNFSGHDSYMSIFRDVSEELKQKANQRRLVTAIEQANESVIITDQTGAVEYVNPAFTEVSGYSSDEIIGRNPGLIRSGEHDNRFYRNLWDTITAGKVWKGRIVNRRKNGEFFTEMATISPVRDAFDVITNYVAVKRDVSHEVELEGKLRQAQKMEAIGTLAGGIAHDFNNILGAILGFTDMALLQSDPDAPIHESLLHIRKGGKRAADLVQQILTFSRQSSTEKKQIALTPLIKESLQLLRASLPSTITINQELQADDALVLADATQLQQIVINLCTNAFQAMREHGGQLTIRLEELLFTECGKILQLKTDRCIRLIVADTGAGIEPAILERIFDPFFTTKEPGEGTGMGLSVVHGIIRDLGGEITVDSAVGSGTTFTVLLPAVESNGEDDEEVQAPLPMGTEHILVVDDEKDILTTSKMMLSHLGYKVSVNPDPAAMLQQLEKGEFECDLVVTDQTMPQLTGLEFIQGLHRLLPELPVILCTGYSDRVNGESVRKAGGVGLLMKPVELRDLAIMIRDALDAKGRAR